jgi:flagellar protein FliS
MNQYFEQMILTASPAELIRLLYRRAIGSVREAREHLKNGRIMERGQSINNAWLVLAELSGSLNVAEAPELSKRLAGLYCYMQTRLLDANLRQEDRPLAEVVALLSTLFEAWEKVPDLVSVPEVGIKDPWGAASIDDEPVRLALSA